MFSAGFDLDFIKTIKKETNEEFTALFHRAYRAIMFCTQPVIAAVGGPAIAGGFDLTLMCDIRYASERAKFGQREVVLSLNPLLDPLWRIIGMGAAKELALTGRIIDAAEAFRLGYVSRVFLLTYPRRKASAASIMRPVRASSLAAPIPIILHSGSSRGFSESTTSRWPNFALSEA